MNTKNIFFLIFLFPSIIFSTNKPPCIIIFVIDGFSFQALKKTYPFFKNGLKNLFNNGTCYLNAYWPHALPSTAPGFAGISCGSYPKNHGIVTNKWYDSEGNKIVCDYDNVEPAAVFSPEGLYSYGRSAKNILIKDISHELIKHTIPIFSISSKSRSSICSAGKNGTAIWYDKKTGYFTSSKAYYNELPSWLKTFNNYHVPNPEKIMPWNIRFDKNSPAYCFKYINNHAYCRGIPVANTAMSLNEIAKKENENPFNVFRRMPQSISHTLRLAKECIKYEYRKEKPFILCIGLNSLDKNGHYYGPDSIEYIDTLYQLDKKIGNFNRKIKKIIRDDNICFIVTADHGNSSIPEIAQKKGIKTAKRVVIQPLIEKINNQIKNKFNQYPAILKLKTPNVYLNTPLLDLSKNKNEIIYEIQKQFLHEPGFKNVWQDTDFIKSKFDDPDFNLFKNQFYPERSGTLVFQTFPYVLVTKHDKGSGHKNPDEENMHVPLTIKSSKIKRKHVFKKVLMSQLTNTILKILSIPPIENRFRPLSI